jgi:hypothetical protein
MKTFDIDSDQVAKIRSADYTKLTTKELYGRRRVSFGSVTADADENDVLGMVKVPANCRMLVGRLLTTALGASVTAIVGIAAQDGSGYIDAAGTVADDPDFFLGATDVSAASTTALANTLALGAGYVTEKEVIITVTLAGANPDEGTVTLDVEYVND